MFLYGRGVRHPGSSQFAIQGHQICTFQYFFDQSATISAYAPTAEKPKDVKIMFNNQDMVDAAWVPYPPTTTPPRPIAGNTTTMRCYSSLESLERPSGRLFGRRFRHNNGHKSTHISGHKSQFSSDPNNYDNRVKTTNQAAHITQKSWRLDYRIIGLTKLRITTETACLDRKHWIFSFFFHRT